MNNKANKDADFDLIKNFIDGKNSAFNELVLKHKNKVFNICYRYSGHYEDANDIAQEVFVKIYKSLKNFRFQASFSTWLYIITINTCKNRVSGTKYRFFKNMFSFHKPYTNNNENSEIEFGDEKYSPRKTSENKEKMNIIQIAINNLNSAQKEIIILRDIEGLSYSKISEITGLKIGTVKSKISRAREILKTKLEKFL